jgi:hypothetical protein
VFHVDQDTKAAWALDDTGKVVSCPLSEGRRWVIGGTIRLEEVGVLSKDFSGQWDKLRQDSELVFRELADKLYVLLEEHLDKLRAMSIEGRTHVLITEDSVMWTSGVCVKTFAFSAVHLIQPEANPPLSCHSLTMGRLPRPV